MNIEQRIRILENKLGIKQRKLTEQNILSFQKTQQVVFEIINNYKEITGYYISDIIDRNGKWNNVILRRSESKIKEYLQDEYSLDRDEINALMYRLENVIFQNYKKYISYSYER